MGSFLLATCTGSIQLTAIIPEEIYGVVPERNTVTCNDKKFAFIARVS